MQRYFIKGPLVENQTINLPNDVQKHWLKVMRANADDKAEFVDVDSHQVFVGRLMDSDNEAKVKLESKIDTNPELPYHITIACGIPKKDKADLITMKATELGVDQIIFFPSEWSIAKWKGNRINKKLHRLNTIAQNASQQSHRTVIPKVTYMESLTQVLNLPFSKRVVAYEESGKSGETSALNHVIKTLNNGDSFLALFGPEGGISPSEIKEMNQKGVISVGLGPRILRTETAPLYLLSAVSAFSELS